MKKKVITGAASLALAGLAALSLASCGGNKLNNGGNVFHIYAWNTEFQGFFNKYVSDEKSNDNPNATSLRWYSS